MKKYAGVIILVSVWAVLFLPATYMVFLVNGPWMALLVFAFPHAVVGLIILAIYLIYISTRESRS